MSSIDEGGDQEIERVQHSRRLVDQAYQILRQSIISRKIKPGERILQVEIAGKLGVSQMIIREALSRLAAEGLVYHEPYKGIRAVPNSIDDLVDLYDLRILLEGLAMEQAAKHITGSELERMREMLPDTVFNLDDPSSPEVAHNNREFHWIAIRACKRRHLIRMLELIWNMIDPYLIYTPELRQTQTREILLASHEEDLQHHSLLIEALKARDGERARELNDRILHSAGQRLIETMKTASGPYEENSIS